MAITQTEKTRRVTEAIRRRQDVSKKLEEVSKKVEEFKSTKPKEEWEGRKRKVGGSWVYAQRPSEEYLKLKDELEALGRQEKTWSQRVIQYSGMRTKSDIQAETEERRLKRRTAYEAIKEHEKDISERVKMGGPREIISEAEAKGKLIEKYRKIGGKAYGTGIAKPRTERRITSQELARIKGLISEKKPTIEAPRVVEKLDITKPMRIASDILKEWRKEEKPTFATLREKAGLETIKEAAVREPLLGLPRIKKEIDLPVEKKEVEPKTVDIARRIAEYNLKVRRYSDKPSIFRDETKKKELELERDKLVILIGRRMPEVPIETVLARPEVGKISPLTVTDIVRKIEDEKKKKIPIVSKYDLSQMEKPVDVRFIAPDVLSNKNIQQKIQLFQARTDIISEKRDKLEEDVKGLESWRQSNIEKVAERKAKLDLTDVGAVTAYNKWLDKLHQEDVIESLALESRRLAFEKERLKNKADVERFKEETKGLGKDVEKRQAALEREAKKIEQKTLAMQEKYFVKKKVFPKAPPGVTVRPEKIVKEKWWMGVPFVPGIAGYTKEAKELEEMKKGFMEKYFPVDIKYEKLKPFIPTKQVQIGTEWVPAIRTSEGQLIRAKIGTEWLEVPKYKTVTTGPPIGRPIISGITKEPDLSRVAAINEAIELGKLKITGENVGEIKRAIQESGVPLRRALERDTTYKYYKGKIPTYSFMKRKTDEMIIQKLQKKLTKYHEKETLKKQAKLGAAMLIPAVASEAIPAVIAAKIPVVSKVVGGLKTAAVTKPGQALLWGGYGTSLGLRGVQEVKEKDIYGLVGLGVEATGVGMGVKWTKAMGGKPITRTFIEPVKGYTAQAETPFATFLRGGKPVPLSFAKITTGPEWKLKPELYIQTLRGEVPVSAPGQKMIAGPASGVTITQPKLRFLRKDVGKVAWGTKYQYIPETGKAGWTPEVQLGRWNIPGDPGYIGSVKVSPEIGKPLGRTKTLAYSLLKPGVTADVKRIGADVFIKDTATGKWMEYNPQKWHLTQQWVSEYGAVAPKITPEIPKTTTYKVQTRWGPLEYTVGPTKPVISKQLSLRDVIPRPTVKPGTPEYEALAKAVVRRGPYKPRFFKQKPGRYSLNIDAQNKINVRLLPKGYKGTAGGKKGELIYTVKDGKTTIDWMSTHPEHTGTGRKLMQEFLKTQAGQKVEVISTEPAVGFYQKYGFVGPKVGGLQVKDLSAKIPLEIKPVTEPSIKAPYRVAGRAPIKSEIQQLQIMKKLYPKQILKDTEIQVVRKPTITPFEGTTREVMKGGIKILQVYDYTSDTWFDVPKGYMYGTRPGISAVPKYTVAEPVMLKTPSSTLGLVSPTRRLALVPSIIIPGTKIEQMTGVITPQMQRIKSITGLVPAWKTQILPSAAMYMERAVPVEEEKIISKPVVVPKIVEIPDVTEITIPGPEEVSGVTSIPDFIPTPTAPIIPPGIPYLGLPSLGRLPRGYRRYRTGKGVIGWTVVNPIRDLPSEFFGKRIPESINKALGIAAKKRTAIDKFGAGSLSTGKISGIIGRKTKGMI